MASKIGIILIAVGALLAVGSLVFGWFAFPAIIHGKISQQIRLVEGGDTWKKWENIPIPIFMKIHIFNITNPWAVQYKGEKPILEQVGPYVYQQKRVKTDIKTNPENDTVYYRQPIYYHFREDMTNGSLNDIISIVNLPYVGITARAESEGSASRYMIQETFQEYKDVQPFTNITVDEFLFKGEFLPYVQHLSELKGEPLMPNYTFGLYYGKNGTNKDLMEVYTGVEDSSKFGVIASWNQQSNLTFWDDEYCNMINGSDGALFPPFVTRDRVLPIFSADLCRSLYLTYESDTEVHGLQGYRFTLPEILLQDPSTNKDNQCFCTKRGGSEFQNCPPKGAYQIQSCRKGVPLVVSLPHFLDGSENLTNACIGLNPQRELHETVITLEPNTGVLLQAHKRIQMNIELRSNRKFKPLKFVPNMILPIFWIDESAELTEASADRIKSKLIKPQKVVGTAMWAIFGVGCVLVIAGLLTIIHDKRKDRASYMNTMKSSN